MTDDAAVKAHNSPELTKELLHQALERQRATRDSLGGCLVALGWPDEVSALQAVADMLNIRFVDLADYAIDQSLAAGIPPELINRKRVIPVAMDNGHILLAMQDPFDFETVDHIRILVGKEVQRAVCTAGDMEAAMQTFYGFSVERMIKNLERPEEPTPTRDTDIGHLREIASEPTVVNLVNLMMARAIRDRASDIHIEAFQRELKVKYRIDGILHEMPSPPKHLQDAIVSRVKIMADMNIAERYIPQDGHIELNLEGREVDVRVATVPTIYGESLVMRLLDKTTFLFGLDQIGFERNTLTCFRTLLSHPHGLALVCGPTGCGKTTTLYAALREIFTPERKFITIEDPVEYELSGVNQIPVRPKRGLTFASGLRAIVRQDPDIIMVGEIRDRETADIAMRSALTGHLVISSLHTNSATESITRLLDMGVESYLIASALRGALAQRLVRRVCSECRERVEPAEEELEQMRTEIRSNVQPTMYRGQGCPDCKGTGYRGRTAIAEMLTIDDELRNGISRRDNIAALLQQADDKMQTMRQAGWLKVLRGITTSEELLRATYLGDALDAEA